MKKNILIMLLFFVALKLTAAGYDTLAYPELDKVYLKSYFYDSKDFVVSPVKWGKRQWLELGVAAGAGVLAYIQEEAIQKYFIAHQSITSDHLSTYVFEPYGRFAPVLIGGLYIGGRLAKDNRLAGTSLTAAKAFVVSSVTAGIVKQLAHRHRPYQDEIPDHGRWEGPVADIDFTSFPSGHSTAAFSMATVFALEYRHTVWVPVLAYALATGTAVSRVYDNKHWATDVVMGSALGFVTGRFMWKQCLKGDKRLTILPSAGVNTASLTFIIRLAEPKHYKACL
jgi:membrane-associated phospholipid phosphatase